MAAISMHGLSRQPSPRRTSVARRWSLTWVITAVLITLTACSMPPPNGAGGAKSPGVTDSTINFGFIYATGAEQLAKSIGGPDFSAGDSKRQIEAVVKSINDSGGVAGRQVKLVTYAYKVTDPIDSQLQAACTYFTEDNEVFAVSGNVQGVTGPTGEVLLNCLAKKNVTYIESANAGDTQTYNSHPNIAYAPGTLTADRKSALLVDALVKANWFGSKPVVGIHSVDTPMWHRIVDEVVKPRLREHGLDVAAEFYFKIGASGTSGAADVSAATLQFKNAGVTNVLNIGNHPLLFGAAAESQGWHPKWSVDSDISPVNWVAKVPPAQLAGSLGIGWAPSRDLTSARSVDPVNEAESRCADIMTKAGENPKQAVAWQYQLTACGSVFFLQKALEAAPEMTAAGLAAGMVKLGHDYQDPSTWRTNFAAGRTDGLGAYRILSYADQCHCYEYSSDLIDVPAT